jgi:import inner membrane translocase subunit TIM23
MGLFDALRGKGSSSKGKASTQDLDQELSKVDDETSNVTNLGGASGGLPSASSSAIGRLYNPYEGLHASLDPKVLGSIQLPTSPEHLFSEEATRHKRSWGENLSYYTGLGYLGGTLAGGVYGGIEGSRAKPQASLDTAKLRLNRLINSTMHRGRMFGNTFGILGLFYAVSESFAQSKLDHTIPDDVSSVLAGLVAGAIYRAAAGPRSMAVGSAMGGMAALALVVGKNAVGSQRAHM